MSKWYLSRNGGRGGCQKPPSCSWDSTSNTAHKEPSKELLTAKIAKNCRQDREEATTKATTATSLRARSAHEGNQHLTTKVHEERQKPTTEGTELHRGRTQSKPRRKTTGQDRESQQLPVPSSPL